MDVVNFFGPAGRKRTRRATNAAELGMKLALQGLIVSVVLAGAARAEEFAIVIGSPVAAQSSLAKRAFMAIRTKGCEDLAKLTLTGKAEGLVNGERRSIPLTRIAAMPAPGVYAVYPEWPGEGVWLVSLAARCEGASAFALVPAGPHGFSRESSLFLNRPPSESEIQAALKARKESKVQP